MKKNNIIASTLIIGLSIILGLSSLGLLVGSAAVKFKSLDRTVTVKGLSEQEHKADIVIWPIQFTEAGNNLTGVYNSIEKSTGQIKTFLRQNGIKDEEITVSPPSITDKLASEWNENSDAAFRYTSTQSVTVYSENIESVRSLMNQLAELGKDGIVFTGNSYQIEYLFNRLNEIKPAMIEEATTNAREVAEKFAADSDSRLGKIKKAAQGQFSISPRDNNNPHIKKIRVVSTIEYYLSD
ncbi:MAG: SIMPL domain-containing protein [Spirochaetales bacterium]|nr:SIMPL domain-containing protein [Spirochaetales bacterium]